MMDRVKSIQRRGRPRLAFEAVAEFLGRSLDGDQPVQPSVTRLVDISHPAFAQLFEDDIGAEPRTRLQGHGCGILPCAPQRPANSPTTGSFLDSWFPRHVTRWRGGNGRIDGSRYHWAHAGLADGCA